MHTTQAVEPLPSFKECTKDDTGRAHIPVECLMTHDLLRPVVNVNGREHVVSFKGGLKDEAFQLIKAEVARSRLTPYQDGGGAGTRQGQDESEDESDEKEKEAAYYQGGGSAVVVRRGRGRPRGSGKKGRKKGSSGTGAEESKDRGEDTEDEDAGGRTRSGKSQRVSL